MLVGLMNELDQLDSLLATRLQFDTARWPPENDEVDGALPLIQFASQQQHSAAFHLLAMKMLYHNSQWMPEKQNDNNLKALLLSLNYINETSVCSRIHCTLFTQCTSMFMPAKGHTCL
jgi:hypothetical protein